MNGLARDLSSRFAIWLRFHNWAFKYCTHCDAIVWRWHNHPCYVIVPEPGSPLAEWAAAMAEQARSKRQVIDVELPE